VKQEMRGERVKGSGIWRRHLDQEKERERTGWESRMENIRPRGRKIIWELGEKKSIVPGSLGEHEHIRRLETK